MKPALFLVFLFLLFGLADALHRLKIYPRHSSIHQLRTQIKKEDNAFRLRLQNKVAFAKNFVSQKGFSNRYAFFIDMRLPSGKKRFFVYDLQKDSIITSGLVAHGSCNTRFLETAQFSNTPECGCSAVDKYRVGESYSGRFGNAFKLYGLDETNFNAYKRFIVLHAYGYVPDEEVYPNPICNSLGCPMVSFEFLEKLTTIIGKAKKPVLLWIYN